MANSSSFVDVSEEAASDFLRSLRAIDARLKGVSSTLEDVESKLVASDKKQREAAAKVTQPVMRWFEDPNATNSTRSGKLL